jgi:hypothetical protein
MTSREEKRNYADRAGSQGPIQAAAAAKAKAFILIIQHVPLPVRIASSSRKFRHSKNMESYLSRRPSSILEFYFHLPRTSL